MMRGSSKRSCSIVLMAMIGVLCFVGPAATAASVTLDMRDNNDGTFDLYASSTLGDNSGIAYYNIDLVNILTAVHESPTDFVLGGKNETHCHSLIILASGVALAPERLRGRVRL